VHEQCRFPLKETVTLQAFLDNQVNQQNFP
jgi:hypothetical protein